MLHKRLGFFKSTTAIATSHVNSTQQTHGDWLGRCIYCASAKARNIMPAIALAVSSYIAAPTLHADTHELTSAQRFSVIAHRGASGY